MQPEIALIPSLIPNHGSQGRPSLDVHVQLADMAAEHVVPKVETFTIWSRIVSRTDKIRFVTLSAWEGCLNIHVHTWKRGSQYARDEKLYI